MSVKNGRDKKLRKKACEVIDNEDLVTKCLTYSDSDTMQTYQNNNHEVDVNPKAVSEYMKTAEKTMVPDIANIDLSDGYERPSK